MPRLRDQLAVDAYRFGSLAARLTPSAVAAAGASALGMGFLAGMRDRRAMVERHLRRVQPELRGRALSHAVHAAFDSYARYYVETFRLPSLSAHEIERGFTGDGLQHLDDALAKGRGVILALPHLGGWEWAGRWVAESGHAIMVVVEPIEPPELFQWFVELRRSLGMQVVALGEGAGPALIKALKANTVVCLLCDRDLAGGGPSVEFFGEPTTLPAGPAAISLRTGAPLLPAAVYFTTRRDGHLGVVRPPIPTEREGSLRADVARVTQLVAHELEGLIRRAPTQWHLFQANWPSDPGYAS